MKALNIVLNTVFGTLLLLTLTGRSADAASGGLCGGLFLEAAETSPNFLMASDFYRNPVNPQSMKADGVIVITRQLLDRLTLDRPELMKASLVLDLRSLSAREFIALMKRSYKTEARFRTEFKTGFQDVELTGSSQDILRFLNNGYAVQSVLWAGQTRGTRYNDSVMPFFNESFSNSRSDGYDSSRRNRPGLETINTDGSNRSPVFQENGPRNEWNDDRGLF